MIDSLKDKIGDYKQKHTKEKLVLKVFVDQIYLKHNRYQDFY